MTPELRKILVADLYALLHLALVVALFISATHLVAYLATPPFTPLAGGAAGLLAIVGWLLGTRYPAVRQRVRDAAEEMMR